jgi:hypothetical protein
MLDDESMVRKRPVETVELIDVNLIKSDIDQWQCALSSWHNQSNAESETDSSRRSGRGSDMDTSSEQSDVFKVGHLVGDVWPASR